MLLPEGISNNFKFLLECKSKGIKITSRFRGVCQNWYNNDKSNPCWLARYTKERKCIFYVRKPFTIEGEIQARLSLVRFMKENNIEERFSVKRKVKKNH